MVLEGLDLFKRHSEMVHPPVITHMEICITAMATSLMEMQSNPWHEPGDATLKRYMEAWEVRLGAGPVPGCQVTRHCRAWQHA